MFVVRPFARLLVRSSLRVVVLLLLANEEKDKRQACRKFLIYSIKVPHQVGRLSKKTAFRTTFLEGEATSLTLHLELLVLLKVVVVAEKTAHSRVTKAT